ncbi:DUF421 domain-containing protein [Salinimonas marina]|uniref:DUF421 domain-containing protein n=1 Tax=Salinimonas marina TaxID=2785918 RepID=A0A7S9DVF2_9ALTE|nr:YetF domain-containing protein [Salinimonas marina]QPG04575.1 DUF421 domain-containing protein [Salinimonas marina]
MIFFQSWPELWRVLITAVATYLICVAFVGVFGKRSNAKMNNFDWIVTVAMGSILGSAVLLKKVVIVEVALALFVLLLLQYTFTLLSVRFTWFHKLMNKSPALLYYDKHFISSALKKERVTEQEVLMGMRAHGFTHKDQVKAVILEPNGDLSVLPSSVPGKQDQSMPELVAAFQDKNTSD